MSLFTIGHSNLEIDEFFALLARHDVDLLADVRSSPYSAHVPHFNRGPIEREATGRGLTYRYLGTELGGRPADPRYTTDGRPDYEKMAGDPRLLETLGKVVEVAARRNVALMCSEGDPAVCHRTRLLGRLLLLRFEINVQHIVRAGLITQTDLLPEQTTLF